MKHGASRGWVLALAALLALGALFFARHEADVSSGLRRWDVIHVGDAPTPVRVVGLPGERLRLARGSLWIRARGASSWVQPERPEALGEELQVAVFPWQDVPLESAGAFLCEGAWQVDGPGRLHFGGGGVARARYADPITRTTRADLPTTVGPTVDDIRVRCGVRPQDDVDFEIAWHAPAGWAAVLTLSTGQADRSQGLRITRPGAVSTQTWSRGLSVGKATAVDLEAVAGVVRVRLDGALVHQTGLGTSPPPEEGVQAQALTLGARGGALLITGLTLLRSPLWTGADALGRDGIVVAPKRVAVLDNAGRIRMLASPPWR